MTKKHEYNIDLLRILAMLFIVILHCLGHGGVLRSVLIDSNKYKIVWLLEVFCYSAVNIFGIISGYVSYKEEESRTKISNYIRLWLEVVFYAFIITLCLKYINPDIVTSDDFKKSFFPVTFNTYWYFTAYTGLFAFMPLINKAIRHLDEQILKKIFLVFILLFSFCGTFANSLTLGEGYSVIWLIILYTIGAIIKKCDIGKKLKPLQSLLFIISLNLFTLIYLIYGKEHDICGLIINNKLFINYTSPTILGVGILNVLLFSKIKLNNWMTKLTKFISTSSFAIYLLNEHYLIRNNYIQNSFIPLASKHSYEIVFKVIIFSLAFVILAIIIDKIRYYLFKLLKVDKLAIFLDKIISKIFNKLAKII